MFGKWNGSEGRQVVRLRTVFHSSRHAMALTLGQIVENHEERKNVALSQGLDEWTCLCQGKELRSSGGYINEVHLLKHWL